MTHFYCDRCQRFLMRKEVILEEKDSESFVFACAYCDAIVKEVE